MPPPGSGSLPLGLAIYLHLRTSSLLGSGRQTLETTLYQYALPIKGEVAPATDPFLDCSPPAGQEKISPVQIYELRRSLY